VAGAAERFVRILIRRPQAYSFKRGHPDAPIPGLIVLDATGEVRGVLPFGN